ncbi:MAG: ABC transporter ATP-binding protein [Deltaproteobacteria bacterium]|nr:ABC transporter ATP-binding protein [Deltaproteobacteria bacterium]
MAEPVLLLEGVFKSYGNGVVTEVLKGVDLRVERGEFAALIGPSGSGKSTLLNILGLLDRPTRGRLTIAGEDTTHLDDAGLTRLRGRTIGFVFQFHHLLPGLSAAENVMMPMIAATGRTSKEMVPRARRLLERVGLGEKAGARPNALSGGQQQRVAIARALALDPPLVLADEPTGNLDTKTADQIFEVMREFNRELGVAFLIVTHDPRLATRCDRTIDLVDGRIVSDQRRAGT